MNYCPNTANDQAEMLKTVGVNSVEGLFGQIPEKLRAKGLKLPEGKTEMEVTGMMETLASKNDTGLVCFAGGGTYDHFIPSVVDALAGRTEFYTAYTPYQPECSQGTLQALFEYQTAICRLTGMDVSNASLYDGGTAVAEAVLMAVRITGREVVVVDGAVNPFHREVLKTYLKTHKIELLEIVPDRDSFDRKAFQSVLNDRTACVVLQNPNFFGSLDDYTDIAQSIHAKGGLLIVSAYPVALGMVKTPGEMGADIAVGDGQSLGNPMAFGGPTVGFITAKKEHVRNLPGRIVGETADKNGKRGFVLTLQAREQHIKRQKATSNICSNQSLCALKAVIYLGAMGREGLAETAELNRSKAEFAKKTLSKIRGVSVWNKRATFNEFVLELPKKSEKTVKKLLDRGMIAGIPLAPYFDDSENRLLVAVTEKRTKEEIVKFAEKLEAVLWK